MDFFIILMIMVNITMSIVMFIEIEKILDNTFDIGRDIRRSQKRRVKK